MTAQPGKNVYISQGTGTAAVPIVCLQTTEMNLNGQAVDVTSRDSGGFSEILPAAGIAKMTLKGDGVVNDSTSWGSLCDLVTAQTLNPYTINFGTGHTYTGMFQLTSMDIKGPYNKEQTYAMQFESSGSLTRT